MEIIFALWSTAPFIDLPNQDISGWFGLVICLLALGWGIKSIWHSLNGHSIQWWLLLAALFVATPIGSSFLGLGLRLGNNVIVPEMPVEIGSLSIMILSAVPWVLAAGLLGPLPAVGLALLAGFTRAIGETHSAYTIMEFGFLGLAFAWSVNQPYRSKLFAFLRHPLGAFVLTASLYIPLIMILSLFRMLRTNIAHLLMKERHLI